MAPRRIKSSPLESTFQNADLRSGYGDMHAIRDATAMAAHVADLCSRGMIDEHMAVKLSNPFTHRMYSSQYLATHPDYTGEQPEMTSIITAERHRLKRDKEMKQFVEDYEAGRIDEWGNAVAQEAAAEAEEPVITEQDTTSMAVATGHNESDGESSELTDAEMQLEMLAASPPKTSLPGTSTPLPTLSKTQIRKSKLKLESLKPSPGALDYSKFKYGELVAECRKRKILGGGCSQSVRNRLIQDDINVKQGLPRELVPHKGKARNHHQHESPPAMQVAAEKDNI